LVLNWWFPEDGERKTIDKREDTWDMDEKGDNTNNNLLRTAKTRNNRLKNDDKMDKYSIMYYVEEVKELFMSWQILKKKIQTMQWMEADFKLLSCD
jgi:hypothetical protein